MRTSNFAKGRRVACLVQVMPGHYSFIDTGYGRDGAEHPACTG